VPGFELYPNSCERELDAFAERNQVRRALLNVWGFLAHRGYSVIYPPTPWGDRLVGFSNACDGVESVEIHTIRGFTLGPGLLADRVRPSYGRGAFQIDAWTSLVKEVLMPLPAGDLERFRFSPQQPRLDWKEREVGG
jgi:hypothetical protein